MTHTQNASDAQCNSQKTQTIGEGKNAAENDVQSCSQLKRGSEPAFPGMDYVSQYGKKNPEGMTMRDYFAAEASEEDIQEFIPATRGEAAEFQQRHGFSPSRQWARYCHADAMLKAREGVK